jgi:hypothetical protein
MLIELPMAMIVRFAARRAEGAVGACSQLSNVPAQGAPTAMPFSQQMLGGSPAW